MAHKKFLINSLRTIFILTLLATPLFFAGCEKDDPVELPEISTIPASDISSTSASSGGYLIDDGGSPVTDRGIVWSTDNNPTLEFNEGLVSAGTGEGIYHLMMEGLTPETTYFVRAYAVNSLGESYGNETTFTTLHESATGLAMTDIDGNQYNTTIINNREWMTENLRVRRYRNGDDIHTGLDNENWFHTLAGAYTIYSHDLVDGIGSDNEMAEAYGLQYNWHAVETEMLCPTGWRVSTAGDWDETIEYLVENHPDINNSNIGDHLKSCRQEGSPLQGECDTSEHPRWDFDDIYSGTDDFDFSALPGGQRNLQGYHEYLGRYGYWWTADEAGEFFSWARVMGYNTGTVATSSLRKKIGLSVRCVRDVD
ncbi:MAG: hypothetical protein EA408_13045 [Marinilabiliales bacterium]|nr:MAG: hypothetical protein EA408_13045 [Marinilabiliales bacterium]